jgi:ornithine cyclodeaminase/alanine dehydrogenase-like protein (mu-crystallin family)
MKVLILSQGDVRKLLTMPECIDLMSDTLASVSKGEAVQPLRTKMMVPDAGLLGMMPAYLAPGKSLGIKILTVFHANHGTEYDSHQGAVLYFEGVHGSLKAILDASAVTAIRTAAVSGLATRLLARPDASELALLGSGVQAFTHLEAMMAVRPIKRVRVWNRTPEHATEFAARESKRYGVTIVTAPTAEQAVRGAHIVCTTTSSKEPVLKGDWLSPGVHINAAGSSIPSARELDTPAVARSRLFVDRRESTLNEAGDFLFPKKEGVIDDSHIRGELGELILGRVKGRETPGDITLFKSLGIGVEDVASARFVYDKAEKLGAGKSVEFGGQRFDSKPGRRDGGPKKKTARDGKGRQGTKKKTAKDGKGRQGTGKSKRSR